MINVAELLYDPDFSQQFIVNRCTTGTWQNGRFVETDPLKLSMDGVVVPATPKEINQLPEGDRVSGVMAFYSDKQIYVTHKDDGSGNAGTSDQIEWRGNLYRVSKVDLYGDYGFYVAYGVLMEGC